MHRCTSARTRGPNFSWQL